MRRPGGTLGEAPARAVSNLARGAVTLQAIPSNAPAPALGRNQAKHQACWTKNASRIAKADAALRGQMCGDLMAGDHLSRVAGRTPDLEYLKDLKGKRFHELEASLRRRFYQTQIVVHVIDATSPIDLKYDIFKRINIGGSPLKPQEIRHCMSRARSRRFLAELVSTPLFTQCVVLKAARMEDREMALRFAAFYRFSRIDPSFDSYPQRKEQRLDEFLLQAAHDLDDPRVVPESEVADIREAFERALSNNARVFGDLAFRKPAKGPNQRARMSRVLFEIWTVALAGLRDLDDAQARRVKDLATNAMLTDSEFLESFTRGTGNPERIRARFRKAFAVVKQAVEGTS